MNHDQAQEFVRRAVQRVVPGAEFAGLDRDVSLRDTFEVDSPDSVEPVEALAELRGRELAEDACPALDTWDGCAARLAGEARAYTNGRRG
ncbi:phosphopantetheine-binding protein [Streptomyces sp. NPDC051921]|uniref:phosphopantetheine-binding protein n=1 Tax=Streptomyces sp. NPDC051921 TaxID=3155806 RepID=UPI00342DEF56